MNPTDNLELAKHLKTPPLAPLLEACFRAACGRAYYAAHAFARDVLKSAPLSVPADGKAHGQVISLLKGSRDADVKAVGALLDSLRVTRNSADYEVGAVKVRGRPFDQQRAIIAIMQADQVISTIQRISRTDRTLKISSPR